jgi:hypothetical protein
MNIFNSWRAELADELATALVAVEQAKSELSAATEAAIGAKSERESLADSVARLAPHRVMANALRQRLLAADDDLRRPEGILARARNAVANALYRVEDLTDALHQLDEIDPPTMAYADGKAETTDEILVLS